MNGAIEAEIHEHPAPVVNLILDARPMENRHNLAAAAPGQGEPVALNVVASNLPGSVPIAKPALLVLFPSGVRESQPASDAFPHPGGDRAFNFQAVCDGYNNQCHVLNSRRFGGP